MKTKSRRAVRGSGGSCDAFCGPIQCLLLALLLVGLLTLSLFAYLTISSRKDDDYKPPPPPKQFKLVNQIRIATYNLWNTMFHWQLRKLAIAELIRSSGADVVAFQEVRVRYNEDGSTSFDQLRDLQDLLTSDGFLYSAFSPAGKASDGSTEGVGILSRYHFLDSRLLSLSKSSEDVDKNERSILQVTLGVKEEGDDYPSHEGRIDLIVSHLSYNKPQQCKNIGEIIRKLLDVRHWPTVLLGDFNTYSDYEDPMELLTVDALKLNQDNKCYASARDLGYHFDDAWHEWNSDGSKGKGFTFSNMPREGMFCRPDRILFRNGLNADQDLILQDFQLLGGGHNYWNQYYWNIWAARAREVIPRTYPKEEAERLLSYLELIETHLGKLMLLFAFSTCLAAITVRNLAGLRSKRPFKYFISLIFGLAFFYYLIRLKYKDLIEEVLDPASRGPLMEAFQHGPVDIFPSDHLMVYAKFFFGQPGKLPKA